MTNYVFPSTRNLYLKFQPYVFHRLDQQHLEEDIFYMYDRMMTRFLDEQSLIPAGNLVHLKYEDLIANPLQEVERIYQGLQISGFETVLSNISQYISQQKNYEKNRYTVSSAELDRIYRHWHFTIDHWQYSAPPV